MSFLPSDYKSPSSTNYYVKLQEGENRIRILTRPILGWEDWIDGKPVRYEFDKKPLHSHDEKKPLRHFWSFVVFNYNEERIQIMHVTQNTIRKSIEALCRDKDWGDPWNYDIKISKSGKMMETEYVINPVPHKPIDEYIVSCFRAEPCNLNAMFSNADPFASNWTHYTPLATDAESSVASLTITEAQAADLEIMISQCDPDKQEAIMAFVEKQGATNRKLMFLPRDGYDKLHALIKKKRDEYQATQGVTDTLPF